MSSAVEIDDMTIELSRMWREARARAIKRIADRNEGAAFEVPPDDDKECEK